VDSILIDEARTPLIISGPVGDEDSVHYRGYNGKVSDLVRRQNEVVSGLVAEGERLWENEKTRTYAGSVSMSSARLGAPALQGCRCPLPLAPAPRYARAIVRLGNIAER